MRFAVLGGTGRTGRHVVRLALADGHEVTVLVRTPTKVGEVLGADDERVAVVAGDLKDAAAVSRAIAGADAVISAAGPVKGGPDGVMAAAAGAVVAAAQEHGVSRLVWLTGAGVRRPGDTPAVVDRLVVGVMRLVQGGLLRDSVAGVDIVTDSDLDWTVVRAPRLTDARGTGKARAVARVGGGHSTQLPREDLARFLVDVAAVPTWLHEAPVVSA